MKTIWTQGLSLDEKKKRQELILSNKIVLDFLIEIMYNIDRELGTVPISDYDNPSWSHKQAHLNGKRDMLHKLIDICKVQPDQG